MKSKPIIELGDNEYNEIIEAITEQCDNHVGSEEMFYFDVNVEILEEFSIKLKGWAYYSKNKDGYVRYNGLDISSAMGASLENAGDPKRNPNLETIIVRQLLPTPVASDTHHCLTDGATIDEHGRRWTENGKTSHSLGLGDMAQMKLLPTPTCNDATNQTLPPSQAKRNDSIVKRILMGEIKTDMIPIQEMAKKIHTKGMLLTPSASDRLRGEMTLESLRAHNKVNAENSNYSEQMAHLLKDCCPKTDGEPFRLSPLFTEEMMGFNHYWTTLPFTKRKITWIEIA